MNLISGFVVLKAPVSQYFRALIWRVWWIHIPAGSGISELFAQRIIFMSYGDPDDKN